MRPFLDAFCLSKLLFCLNTHLHQSAGKNPLVQICLGVETILVVSLKGSLLQESGILEHHLCPPCNKSVTVATSENCKERLLITWRGGRLKQSRFVCGADGLAHQMGMVQNTEQGFWQAAELIVIHSAWVASLLAWEVDGWKWYRNLAVPPLTVCCWLFSVSKSTAGPGAVRYLPQGVVAAVA